MHENQVEQGAGSLLFMGTEIAAIAGSSGEEVGVPCALRHGIYAIEAGLRMGRTTSKLR